MSTAWNGPDTDPSGRVSDDDPEPGVITRARGWWRFWRDVWAMRRQLHKGIR